jgi:mRNA interferase RelE/StbE
VEVRYNKKFLKDLSIIPSKERLKIETFVFQEILGFQEITSIGTLEKLKGYSNHYKMRFGNYRVGVSYSNDVLTFERVLHRRDIYRYFP